VRKGASVAKDRAAAKPSIARIWRGRTTRECADEYEAYNFEAGIKPLIEKALGVQTFREDREHETEFMTISYWDSLEAMIAFSGPDPTRIHHLERDPESLIELPREIQILRLRISHGNTGAEDGRGLNQGHSLETATRAIAEREFWARRS
jgi:heme-degrading monooxygenase HmoA